MALLDIFKKKKKPEKAAKALKPSKSKEPKRVVEVREEVKSARPVKEKKEDIAWRVLKKPHVTEKATALAKEQYTFDIWPGANKAKVKRAVESAYGVDVVSVKILQARRKLRRRGRIEGWKRGDKKAIVRLKEGQKIEVLPR